MVTNLTQQAISEAPEISQCNENVVWVVENYIYKFKPKAIVEVGTYKGGFFYVLCKTAPRNSILVTVEVNPQHLNKWEVEGYHPNAHLIVGDSHSKAIQSRVTKILGDKPIDFLFIDANHNYGFVKKDFELWSPLVCGFVAFHDIYYQEVPGAMRLWAEIKEKSKFTCESGQGQGIGVVMCKHGRLL